MGNYPAIMRSKWFLPLFSLALGLGVLAASGAGGSLGSGLISLGIIAGFGLFILLAGRSETIRGLSGDGRDERFAQIDLRATAVAGLVLIVTLIVAGLTEIARGVTAGARTPGCAPSPASATRSRSHSSAGAADRPRLLLQDLCEHSSGRG
jgi:hypothetical protein